MMVLANKKKVDKKLVTAIVLVSLGNLLFFFTIWLLSKYDHIYIDQIIFQLKAPAVGANRTLAGSAVVRVGVFAIVLTGIEIFLYRLFGGYIKKWRENWHRYAKYCTGKACDFFRKTALPVGLSTLLVAVTLFVAKLEVVSYISVSSTESDFIMENYADPATTKLTFPEKKRNLIYIFLESMETTYAEPSAGGNITHNFIPELSELAEDNINFSADSGLGGALSYSGTTWTAAAMVAQTSGMLIKVPLAGETYGGNNAFLPGVSTVGEVLAAEGYKQTLLVGSDADFGGRKTYFLEHGNYNIVDINSLKAEGRLPDDYRQWWGYEDDKLFDFAKEEVEKLYESGEPFNFTMLTADTHFPDGYECEDCEHNWENQYANVLSCSSKRVYEFIEWIKEQPFYENTTIILCGDHLTMDPEFLKDINKDYTRTVYNCFINSATTPKREKNRLFGTFDLFPTTLSAMGVVIEGERLGLGTNLFSDVPTLTEKYGYTVLDSELQKKSLFYNEEILEMESPEIIF